MTLFEDVKIKTKLFASLAVLAVLAVLVNMDSSMKTTGEVQASSISLQFALTLICVALAAFMAVTIYRRIVNGTKKELSKGQGITLGEGELTRRLEADNNEEWGDSAKWFNQFVEKLHDIVLQVKAPSEKVAAGSRQIITGNQDHPLHLQEQAPAIEKTASIIEQMVTKIKTNADNSQKTNDISQKASEAAKRGGLMVQKNEASITEMPTSSKKFGDIINVVNEIAFQAKLLALNAAVEAAHSGEQDHGFAVVSSEVHNLAERMAEVARENQVVINDSMEKVKAGNR